MIPLSRESKDGGTDSTRGRRIFEEGGSEMKRGRKVGRDSAEEHLVSKFEWLSEVPWKDALKLVDREEGLLLKGRPINPWIRRVIVKGEKVHARARREYLGIVNLALALSGRRGRDGKYTGG